MPTAAYCDQCASNVYLGADGRCPEGHGPEHLSGHYETGDPDAPTVPAPVPRSQRSSVKVARWALLIIVAVLLLATGCGLYTCSALLTDDDSDVVLPDDPVTPDAPSDGSSSQEAPAEWYAEGAEETEYVLAFVGIEEEAFEAMDRLDAVYPATNDDDTAAAAEALATIEAAYADAQTLEVPAKYLTIHDHFLAGLDSYTQAGAIMAAADFTQLEGDTYGEASGLANGGYERFAQMLDAIAALELVWGTE